MSKTGFGRFLLRVVSVSVLAGSIAAVVLFALGQWDARAADPFLRRTATVRAVEQVGPAVVNITAERVVQAQNPFAGIIPDANFERFFRDFGPPRQQTRTIENFGSGVIFDAAGHVLTNEHVVEAANRVRVTLADGRQFNTRLIGADSKNDLAVLQIETEEKLPWVAPGRSSDLMVGEPVIAIGNPFGLSNTVTTGVISAIDRSVRNDAQNFYHGFLQTDASINPGNSGGPLLNAEGTLIGVNTMIRANAEGIGFAIPIDTARRVVAELLEHGEVVPVWLGLEFQDLDPSLREVMNLPPGMAGALVSQVRKGSPSDEAGVLRGDVIMTFEKRPLEEAREFFEMLTTVTPDQVLRLEIWRDAKTVEVQVIATEFPDERILDLVESLLGMRLQDSRRQGFLVVAVRPESAAAVRGIQRGDLLVALSGRALKDPDELRRAILGLRGQHRVMLVVERQGRRYPVTFPRG